MTTESDLAAFKKELEFLSSCCLEHPQDYKHDMVESVELWVPSVPDEETGYALFRLKDGRWGALEESQDYTGHG